MPDLTITELGFPQLREINSPQPIQLLGRTAFIVSDGTLNVLALIDDRMLEDTTFDRDAWLTELWHTKHDPQE